MNARLLARLLRPKAQPSNVCLLGKGIDAIVQKGIGAPSPVQREARSWTALALTGAYRGRGFALREAIGKRLRADWRAGGWPTLPRGMALLRIFL